jgi:2'-5' RNA ligase
MVKLRMFIAIDIGALKSLVSLEKKLKGIEPSLRLVEPQNIHLTLKFLGEVDESNIPRIKDVIIQSVKNKHPFQMKLKGIGVFPNLNYIQIIWVGVQIVKEDTSLIHSITKKINDDLSRYGFPKDKKLHLHITLARVKKLEHKKELQKFVTNAHDCDFDILKVTHLTLKKSTLTPAGPIYENLVRIKI